MFVVVVVVVVWNLVRHNSPFAVAYPCGYLPPLELGLEQSVSGQTRLVGSNHCSKGECPWQVKYVKHVTPKC